ncbi:cytoplasmic protein [Roseibium algae]|uniref:Cytoplasmic protein n=1 Tax=Roseibium algae TaxID=3123038 RepID=A0ABU8TG73_9HYPH
MTQFRIANFAISALFLSAAFLIGPVSASETNDSRLPACTSGSVQSAVSGALARAEAYYAVHRTVTGIDDIREINGRDDGVSPLARRFCTGTATLTDGTQQTVHYKLVEHAGFVGVSWKVDACISSLDEWHIYGAHCSTTMPR